MTSHIHVKIVEKIEIFRNLADIVHVWNPDWLFFFINLSNSQYTSDLHQNISHQMKCIWQISSKNTKHGQFNTNANANQIQIQQQTRVSFEYDWNHTVQVTHVYFRINDFFPTIWHRNKWLSLILWFIIQSQLRTCICYVRNNYQHVAILLHIKTHAIHVTIPDGHCNTDYTGGQIYVHNRCIQVIMIR